MEANVLGVGIFGLINRRAGDAIYEVALSQSFANAIFDFARATVEWQSEREIARYRRSSNICKSISKAAVGAESLNSRKTRCLISPT